MTTTPLLFSRHVHSPSGIGTTLQWGDIAQLPVDHDFVERGSCRTLAPSTFYPERGEDIAAARAVCHRCPVRPECLAWGLAHELIGIWGGASVRQRRVLRKQTGINVVTPTATAAECGTTAGCRAHYRRGESPCQRCAAARATYEAERSERAS